MGAQANINILDVFLPPANLGLIRDLVVTAWNRVLAEGNNCVELLGTQIKNGIEFLEVKINNPDSLLNYLNQNGVKINSRDDLVNHFSNGTYELSKDGVTLIIGPQNMKGKEMFGKLYTYTESYLYAFGRGFMLYPSRGYKKEGSPKPYRSYSVKVSAQYGFFFYNLNGLNGKSYSKIMQNTYLLTADPITDSSIANRIMNDLYGQKNSLKLTLSRMLSKIKGLQETYPVLQDFVGIRLLLELIDKSINSSIIYTSNLPTIRVYLDNGIQGKLRAYQIIEISPSMAETAKMALMTSSSYLDMGVHNLLSDIKKMMDEGIIIKSGDYVNDIYAFVNSIFQGRPDLDLYYQLKRDIKAQEGM